MTDNLKNDFSEPLCLVLNWSISMSEEEILGWMREKIRRDGFFNATSLAESFLQAHEISDVLDPDFSKTLDAGFKMAQEIRDQQLAVAVH